MELPKELFTPESILTLGGAATAVWLVTNTVRYVFGWNPKWFGLVLGQALAIVGVLSLEEWTVVRFVVAVANGFLIYVTAVGVAAVTGAGAAVLAPSVEGPEAAVPSAAAAPSLPKKRWLVSWF